MSALLTQVHTFPLLVLAEACEKVGTMWVSSYYVQASLFLALSSAASEVLPLTKVGLRCLSWFLTFLGWQQQEPNGIKVRHQR